MNLCLSGFAGCFDDTQYPNIVNEAIEVINAREPNAVTVNETCSGDIAHIADTLGYDMRFATVLIRGEPLDCVDPGGRGVFGNAVMTKEAIKQSADRAFTAQAGTEERRWICVETARQVNVCTTHLSTRSRHIGDSGSSVAGRVVGTRMPGASDGEQRPGIQGAIERFQAATG
jgi:hypothetical protein